MESAHSAGGNRWIDDWIDSVAGGKATMSQRKVSSIEANGGVAAAIGAARSKGVHLVKLTDDKGTLLVAASKEPFVTLC